jgi:hypothetical protein
MVLIQVRKIEQFIGTMKRYIYCIKIMKDTTLEYLKQLCPRNCYFRIRNEKPHNKNK